MLNNQAMRMRLGRDRDELDPREAAYLMHQMKVQGAVREKVAEESIRSQFNMKNMGNVDEVVFGRDMDGSGAVMGAGDDEIISRKAQSSIWNPNFRSEVAEITFGAPPPDSEAMATAALATRLEIPPTMSRADGSYSPTKSLIGDVVFNCGDDSRMQTRLADGQDGVPDRDTSQQLHAAIIDGTGTRGYRREAQELRLKGRSSGISFGGGHSLPMQHPAKAAGEGTEAAFVDAEGRPIPDRHSTAFAGANTATTFEFRGPDNSPPPARAREGIKCPEPGMRQRHTVDLSDRGPVDVHGAPLVPDFLGAKKSTAHSGPPSTFSVATAPFRRVPPGQYMREDGSLRHASPSTMRGGVSSVQGDLAWDPERNAAENNAEHARRRRARVAKAQQSNVDDIVFGHDIDKSAEVVPEDRDRELRNGMRLRAVDGAMLGPKRHVEGAQAESHLREIAMRWDPGGADVGREISEYERRMRDAPLSPGIRKAGGRGPPSQKGLLDYGGAGGTHVPSAAAPPRSQLLGSNVAGIVFHADEDGVGRPPSRQTSFAQAVGLAPKKNLSPERLSRGKLLHSDFSGRAKATSVVDEIVFNKTGDHMRGTNLQANFTTDHHGEFAKGARFCVPGPELSVR